MTRPIFRVAALTALIAVGTAWNPGTLPWITASHAAGDVKAAAAAPQNPPARALPDFSSLMEAVGPAVVNISTTQATRTGAAEGSLDDPTLEFFRRFGIPVPQERPEPIHGLGSGFIVSTDGYVLTNAHVVADAVDVVVKLTDKREFRAKVVGADRRTDVALLKIDGTGLPAVKMGDAAKLKVGEWVAAVGSPFGFDNSVTAGIVSAKARSLPDESYVPFIQTDVAVNPGNSGGPLFNLNGEVVGINSQIYSRTGGFMGLSFAIPIDVAMKVKDQLQKTGKVTRGKLGVGIQQMSKELAESFGLDKPAGALVASVEPGSPAERASVAPGDIILDVNGEKIQETADLPRLIGNMQPGQAVTLKIWRQGATSDKKVTLGELVSEPAAAATAAPEKQAAGGKLGVAVRPLNPDEARQLGISNGLLVEKAEGPAARAGIRPGDVIIGVNSQMVTDAQQFKRMVEAAGSRLALLVQRGESRLYVPIRIG